MENIKDDLLVQKNEDTDGLDLPEDFIQHAGKQLTNLRLLPLSKVEPDPNQPRKINEDDPSLDELMASIKTHGVMNPIHVRYMKEKEKYQIINGERRYRASLKAELEEIPALIFEDDVLENEPGTIIKQLVDNIQREDLNPIEEALVYQKLKEDFGLKDKEIAERVGKSRETVTNTRNLLTHLSREIQEECLRVNILIPKRFLIRLSQEKEAARQLSILKSFLKKAEGEIAKKRKARSQLVESWHFKDPNETPTYHLIVKLLEKPENEEECKEKIIEILEQALAALKN